MKWNSISNQYPCKWLRNRHTFRVYLKCILQIFDKNMFLSNFRYHLKYFQYLNDYINEQIIFFKYLINIRFYQIFDIISSISSIEMTIELSKCILQIFDKYTFLSIFCYHLKYTSFTGSGSCPVPGHVILTCKLHISGKL